MWTIVESMYQNLVQPIVFLVLDEDAVVFPLLLLFFVRPHLLRSLSHSICLCLLTFVVPAHHLESRT